MDVAFRRDLSISTVASVETWVGTDHSVDLKPLQTLFHSLLLPACVCLQIPSYNMIGRTYMKKQRKVKHPVHPDLNICHQILDINLKSDFLSLAEE